MDSQNNDLQGMIASFMQNAKKMDESMRSAYQELIENKNLTVQGKAGGDLVMAHVNLNMQVVRLELAPLLFEEQKEVIAQLIVAAVNQGLHIAKTTLKEELAEVAKKIGVPAEMLASMRGV